MTPPEFTHITPSGVLVNVIQESKIHPGWFHMSNGAMIDTDMLKKWELSKEKANACPV